MKTLVILGLLVVYASCSPARSSFFDDEDDSKSDYDFFSSLFSIPRRPQWSFPEFAIFRPFTSMFNLDPFSDPKTKLYNNTIEEKEINGHTMIVNISYYVNEETGSFIKSQTISLKPTEPKPSKEIPSTTDSKAEPTTPKTETSTEVNKDAENEVHSTDQNSEVADLIA